jgi:hypothetical protein
VGVLDAGVHALRTGRRVDVRGVACDEHPTLAVGVDDAVADPED